MHKNCQSEELVNKREVWMLNESGEQNGMDCLEMVCHLEKMGDDRMIKSV